MDSFSRLQHLIAQQGLDTARGARKNARQAYLFNWFMIPVLVVAGGVNLWYFLQKANLLSLGVGAFTWAVALYLWKQQARWLKDIAFWTEQIVEWEARLEEAQQR